MTTTPSKETDSAYYYPNEPYYNDTSIGDINITTVVVIIVVVIIFLLVIATVSRVVHRNLGRRKDHRGTWVSQIDKKLSEVGANK